MPIIHYYKKYLKFEITAVAVDVSTPSGRYLAQKVSLEEAVRIADEYFDQQHRADGEPTFEDREAQAAYDDFWL